MNALGCNKCVPLTSFPTMDILRVIAIWLGGMLVIFLMISLILPDEVKVSSKVTVDAPAKQVWPQLRYFRNWTEWFSINGEDSLEYRIVNSDGRPGAECEWLNSDDQSFVASVNHKQSVSRERIRVLYETSGRRKYELNLSLNELEDSTEIRMELSYYLPFFRRFEWLITGSEWKEHLSRNLNNIAKRVREVPFMDPDQMEQEVHFGIRYALVKDTLFISDFSSEWIETKRRFLEEWLRDEGVKTNAGQEFLVYTSDSTGSFKMSTGFPIRGTHPKGIDSLSDTLGLAEFIVKRYPNWVESIEPLPLSSAIRQLRKLERFLAEKEMIAESPAVLQWKGSETQRGQSNLEPSFYLRVYLTPEESETNAEGMD